MGRLGLDILLGELRYRVFQISVRPLRCLAASCHPVRLFPSPLTYAAQRCVRTFGMRFGFWSGLRSSLSALNSLTEVEGRLVGTDAMGNRYFEAEPDRDSEVPHRAARPKRFFLVPGQKSIEDSWVQLDTELSRLPSEWDAWLRHRRADPPTLEEIERNTKAAQIRAIKGRESEEKFREELRRRAVEKGEKSSKLSSSSRNKEDVPFPRHPGLEVTPGEQG
ncbi:expressed conserved protein [Echinococcus multilocularis]|uniref:Expressed conserved protein n=1 Tax=Echinococcus multilocularis TaxID=6211 RepID=A0A068YG83_ECHMU|nr:expressed conserved protein [Echinococcus multilocularis]